MNCEFCQSPVHVWFQCPKKPHGWKPARLAKESTESKVVRGSSTKVRSSRAKVDVGSNPTSVDTNYTPDLQPVSTDSSGPNGFEVTPQLGAKFDKKAWMRDNMPSYMRQYRAEVKAGIRVPKPRA